MYVSLDCDFSRLYKWGLSGIFHADTGIFHAGSAKAILKVWDAWKQALGTWIQHCTNKDEQDTATASARGNHSPSLWPCYWPAALLSTTSGKNMADVLSSSFVCRPFPNLYEVSYNFSYILSYFLVISLLLDTICFKMCLNFPSC